ncbi:MAG: S49 family peptidase [Rhizonema sp. NSF051]|nr:S49 family peptidase [Rhizonema sp. NSF051]
MAHELARFRSKLFNTPLLVDSKSFESVLNYVDKRCEGDVVVTPKADNEYSMYSTLHYAENNLGVIHISGPLTNKSTGWEAFCGGTSYESIKEDFEALLEEGVKTVAFMVESGGGEAYGMMDTGNYLRKLADENNVKIISYVDGLSASAAYGLTVISDEIISNKNSEIGSIGVLIRLINDSKALEMNGYARTFISAGTEKIPFAEDGSFRKEFLDDLQYKVDALYKDFTEYVAEHRNISVEAVRNTQANTFLAEDAIALGLADQVMTQEEFYSYLSGEAQNNKEGSSMSNRIFKFSKTNNEETLEMSQLAEMQTQLAAAQEQLAEFSSVKEAFAALQGQFADKEAALTEALAQVATMQQEAVVSKLNARKEKLAGVMSADKVDSVSAALASLDDEAFSVVLAGYGLQKQQLEASDLFQEVGDQGSEVEQTTQASSEDLTLKAAKAKYNKEGK